jgi:hypothetical protein
MQFLLSIVSHYFSSTLTEHNHGPNSALVSHFPKHSFKKNRMIDNVQKVNHCIGMPVVLYCVVLYCIVLYCTRIYYTFQHIHTRSKPLDTELVAQYELGIISKWSSADRSLFGETQYCTALHCINKPADLQTYL